MKEEKSNYSFETSLPAFKENKALNKHRQCDLILGIVRKGANNLLQISQVSGIPQAIVSARIYDLIEDGKVKYEGKLNYNDRVRKKIVLIVPPITTVVQPSLFL